MTVTLDSIGGSSITGGAMLTEGSNDYAEVTMTGAGLTDGETHINHIHVGTGCGDDEYGAVVATLTPLEPTTGGSASATTTVNATDDGNPITLAQIAGGGHVLIIHDAEGTPAACGVIAASTTEAVDTTMPDDVTAPPSTGSGGAESGTGGTALIVVLYATLAGLGLAAVSFAIAKRPS
jgi:hypothetical protein